MKKILLLMALAFGYTAADAQEDRVYIFYFADVDQDGVKIRYFSPILDQDGKVDEKCLTELARKTLQLQAGEKAVIESIEFETSGSFEEAEDLLLNTYTIPERKVAYFKLKPDC